MQASPRTRFWFFQTVFSQEGQIAAKMLRVLILILRYLCHFFEVRATTIFEKIAITKQFFKKIHGRCWRPYFDFLTRHTWHTKTRTFTKNKNTFYPSIHWVWTVLVMEFLAPQEYLKFERNIGKDNIQILKKEKYNLKVQLESPKQDLQRLSDSFTHQTSIIWNTLPLKIKSSPYLASFKGNIAKHSKSIEWNIFWDQFHCYIQEHWWLYLLLEYLFTIYFINLCMPLFVFLSLKFFFFEFR